MRYSNINVTVMKYNILPLVNCFLILSYALQLHCIWMRSRHVSCTSDVLEHYLYTASFFLCYEGSRTRRLRADRYDLDACCAARQPNSTRSSVILYEWESLQIDQPAVTEQCNRILISSSNDQTMFPQQQSYQDNQRDHNGVDNSESGPMERCLRANSKVFMSQSVTSTHGYLQYIQCRL